MFYAIALPYLLTQGIYAGIINAISAVTVGTCNVVTSLYKHKNPDVDKHLKKIDIERRLLLIETVLHKIQSLSSQEKIIGMTEELKVIENYDRTMDPIELSLHYLKETIHEIHRNLSDLNEKVQNHQNKWFSSWRTLNIRQQLHELETNSLLLDKRFNDLMKISKFLIDYRHG